MAVITQKITDQYAIYNSDSMEVMQSFPDGKIHFSIYSPPFGGLYHYSSDNRDLSNASNYDQFLEQYDFFIAEIARITMPGRITAVHCAEIPNSNSGCDDLRDLPGDIIRHHETFGFKYIGRHAIWKEPLWVRNRTMQKNLAHKTLVDDSTLCGVASADYLLCFRNKGSNPIPVAHPSGMTEYAGENKMPNEILSYKNWAGKQTENKFSHWIWRNYASSFWSDIRMQRVLPFKAAKEEEDEKHVHPLQLDVIERAIALAAIRGKPC